jgi:hypothetical protein
MFVFLDKQTGNPLTYPKGENNVVPFFDKEQDALTAKELLKLANHTFANSLEIFEMFAKEK